MFSVPADWWHALVGGVVGAGLMAAVMAYWPVLRSRGRAIAFAEVIPASSAQLQDHAALLSAALDNLSLGVVLFSAERELLFCNQRYVEIYDLPLELAQPGTPTSTLIQHRLNLGLKIDATPTDYVRQRTHDVVRHSSAVHEFQDGRIIAYTITPMPGGGGMATHEDITEREQLNVKLKMQREYAREQEEALRVRNLQFDMAINNMSQGLCFFSGDHRLIVSNEQYVRMYGLPADRVRPGISLREIFDLRFEAGSVPAMSKEEYTTWRENVTTLAERADSVIELRNGRVFKMSHRPMPDGGWVATHEDITEQRRSETRIEHLAHHDALTKLANRALLNERLQAALAAASDMAPMAILQLDLDQFKAVNDTLGHPAGDALLTMVAERLRSLVGGNDTVARMGGDEFAIVLARIAKVEDAERLAQRAIDLLSASYEINGHHASVGVSVGIAIGPADGARADDLLRKADLALYQAKSNGRGTFRLFVQEMEQQMLARRSLEQELRDGLAQNQFELHYQPIFNLPGEDVAVVEALVRWKHPTRGLMAPGTFIPVAEDNGFIVPLGEWIIKEACATAARWPDHVRIAINVSAVQFRQPGLVLTVVAALGASGLKPNRLELEITESTLLQDREAVLGALQALRALGVRIVMDDFGMGYSSLSYLQSFKFDKIKLDRSFVADVTSNTDSLNILKATAALANGLQMGATAEGVETREQLETVVSAGCTEVQGFLLSRPLTASQLTELLHARGHAATAVA